ncbi:MAG: hypothetical protein ACRDN0_02960 [Trebonia sp.]
MLSDATPSGAMLPDEMTARHTAIVTGANHGTGAATARALARRGSAVLCTFLRATSPPTRPP